MDKSAMPPLRGELLTIKEAAKRLGISPSWIYSHRAAGCLPFDFFQPTPGRFLFDSADVDDYLASCRRLGVTRGKGGDRKQ
jgi:excisionase family DNA binding protein